MAATHPTTCESFLELTSRSGLIASDQLAACVDRFRGAGEWSDEPKRLATLLVRDSMLTYFQAEQLLQGRHRGFSMGKYRLLERLGSGGMGSVFLADHASTHEVVALKILPRSNAGKPTVTERFQREARAAVALKHTNVVRVHSLEQDADIRFLVMEYVEGQDLRQLVGRFGPLDPLRAANYIRQAAEGLQHVHDAGLIHRDVKPANLLLNRAGTVKLLDLGLARFVDDEDELTKRQGEGTVLGTADYLSPEQAIDSHEVDQRTDIYSLGATFYYLLTGQSPVPSVPVPQKLICIQTQPHKPIREINPKVPAELAAVVDRMMAKAPAQRFQSARLVAKALQRWTKDPVPPPTEEPAVRLSPLALSVIGKLTRAARRAAAGYPPVARLCEATAVRTTSSDTFSTHMSSADTLHSGKSPAQGVQTPAPSFSRFLPITVVTALFVISLVFLWWLVKH